MTLSGTILRFGLFTLLRACPLRSGCQTSHNCQVSQLLLSLSSPHGERTNWRVVGATNSPSETAHAFTKTMPMGRSDQKQGRGSGSLTEPDRYSGGVSVKSHEFHTFLGGDSAVSCKRLWNVSTLTFANQVPNYLSETITRYRIKSSILFSFVSCPNSIL